MHDVFYFTDIHGHRQLFSAIMQYCNEQDPEAAIIFGGDACDRGESGFWIMQQLLDNPYVLYMKGNHEQMFVNAARAILEHYKGFGEEIHHCNIARVEAILNESYDIKQVYLALYNGGRPTLKDWLLAGASEEFVNRIDNLPLTFSYENLDFCHSGSTWDDFCCVALAEAYEKPVDTEAVRMLLWDRNNILKPWIKDRICVHGHTPVVALSGVIYKSRSLAETRPCLYPSGNGWKIDMDTYAVGSNRAWVLNCLTMKAQGFEYDVLHEQMNPILDQISFYDIINQRK